MRVEHNKLKFLIIAHIIYMLHRRSFKKIHPPSPTTRE